MTIYIITQDEQNRTNLALCSLFDVYNNTQVLEDIILNTKSSSWPTRGFKWSEESKLNQSKSRIGLICCYDPLTLSERCLKSVPEGMIKGRSPKTKHGGKLGIYNTERSHKISEATKGRPVWNKGTTHSSDTKSKMSELAKRRPVICCIQCQKEIKGVSNFMQHLKAKH
jgi:hypothetical protein